MQISRRQFVYSAFGSVSTLLVGCGGSKSNSVTGSGQGEVSLTFSESDEFYEKLTDAISHQQKVVIQFDGEHLVTKDSRLIKEFVEKATNCEDLYKEVLAKEETAEGRVELKHLFDADLLKHDPVQKETKLPSGEVIEPGTVMLVLGILLILSAASVAHAEGYRGRKYSIGIRLNQMELLMEGGK